jgi:hypothetical protein
MSTIINASLDLTKIEKSKIIKGKKGSYINVTMFVNDEVDQYGNNASIIISQTKEEREAKTPRVYLGNGKTVGNGQPKAEETVINGLNF